MEKTTHKNFIDVFLQMRNSKAVRAVNAFLVSPWGICALGALTLLAHVFALEIVLYTLVVLLAVYVSAFGEDLLPILPLFLLCYVSPSMDNNPAISKTSIFLVGNGLIYLAVILAIALMAIITRIVVDKNIRSRMFTAKRALTIGFLVLGLAYVVSGIGSDKYLETFWKNILFGFLQFASLFLLYFVFSVSVEWKKVKKEYFFWAGFVMGMVVLGEILNIYLTNTVVQNGSLVREEIRTGWGIYNNIGAMITLGIPCALYLAIHQKHGYVFIVLSVLMLAGVVMSCSRASIVVAVLVFIVGNILLTIATPYKWNMLSLVAILGIGALIGILFFSDELAKLFMRVPDIIKPSEDGGISFNDSDRFSTYRKGFKAFLKFPIFGDSFYPSGDKPWQVGTIGGVEQYMAFFPPRWHNTIIQLLASCGIVGILAYAFHRIQTIILILKKRNVTTLFITLAILALLGMSLLDCHLFNIGPAFFYSIALTFIEFLPTEKEKENKK